MLCRVYSYSCSLLVDYSPQSSNTDIHDLINDPRAAIEKGWSLLSSVGKAAVELGRHVKNNAVNGEYVNPAVIDQIRDNVNYYVNSLTQPRVKKKSKAYMAHEYSISFIANPVICIIFPLLFKQPYFISSR